MPSPRRWLAPALYMLMILAFSSIPGSTGADGDSSTFGWVPSLISNALHLPLYAGLAFLWARALLAGQGLTPRGAAVIAVAVAAGFGLLDELYQGITPGRTTSLADWLANAVGAAAGAAVFLRLHRRAPHTGKNP